jgi:hypothetical protein
MENTTVLRSNTAQGLTMCCCCTDMNWETKTKLDQVNQIPVRVPSTSSTDEVGMRFKEISGVHSTLTQGCQDPSSTMSHELSSETLRGCKWTQVRFSHMRNLQANTSTEWTALQHGQCNLVQLFITCKPARQNPFRSTNREIAGNSLLPG